MKPQHTPGPWHVDVMNNVWRSGDTKIAGLSEQPVQAEPYRVQTLTERKANAHLIAAAPELLEALDALWRQAAQSSDLLGTSYGQAALDLAVAALARAKESFPC
jgi:hypothetical protein